MMQEETYLNIISEMQQERVKIRTQNIMDRLKNLEQSEGSMSSYIKNHREKRNPLIKLPKATQEQLENATQKIDLLKTQGKLFICLNDI